MRVVSHQQSRADASGTDGRVYGVVHRAETPTSSIRCSTMTALLDVVDGLLGADSLYIGNSGGLVAGE